MNLPNDLITVNKDIEVSLNDSINLCIERCKNISISDMTKDSEISTPFFMKKSKEENI